MISWFQLNINADPLQYLEFLFVLFLNMKFVFHVGSFLTGYLITA